MNGMLDGAPVDFLLKALFGGLHRIQVMRIPQNEQLP